jgi:hypothetical protein
MAPPVVCALLLLLLPSACILPLQFEEQQDAGGIDQDNPPEIVISSADPSMLSLAVIEESAPPKFTVQVRDKDVDDTLYFRVFRDYHIPPAKPAVTDTATSTRDASNPALRNFTIDTNTWCQAAAPGTQFLFEVMVSDRPFLELSVEPLFRAVPAGAKTARSYWMGECQQ